MMMMMMNLATSLSYPPSISGVLKWRSMGQMRLLSTTENKQYVALEGSKADLRNVYGPQIETLFQMNLQLKLTN